MSFAARRPRPARGRSLIPHLDGIAAPLAWASIIAVPVLVGLTPTWMRRWTLPALAVSSVGIYATTPDTEHTKVMMLLVGTLGVIAFVTKMTTPRVVGAAIAFFMMGAAIVDSAGRAAPIVRAAGCFAVLLVLPLLERGPTKTRQPRTIVVLVTHGAVAVFASRALVHDESIALNLVGIALALIAAAAIVSSVKA